MATNLSVVGRLYTANSIVWQSSFLLRIRKVLVSIPDVHVAYYDFFVISLSSAIQV
jgi:hypothetical protein